MIRRMRFGSTNLFAALAATLCLGMSTGASAAIEPANDSPNPDARKPLEQLEQLAEIRVRGRSLARTIADAEDDFFALYNKLNKVEDFDVLCGHMSVSGSLIMKRACVPAFLGSYAANPILRWPGMPTGCGGWSRSGTVAYYEGNSTQIVYEGTGSCFSPPAFSAPSSFPVGPSIDAVAMNKRGAYVANVLKVINSDARLVAKVHHLDTLYQEMELTKSRFIKVRSVTPFIIDARLRPR
jgi:hypothetical protein